MKHLFAISTAALLLLGCGSDSGSDDSSTKDASTEQADDDTSFRPGSEDEMVTCDIDDPCCVDNTNFDIAVCAGERFDGGTRPNMDASVNDAGDDPNASDDAG